MIRPIDKRIPAYYSSVPKFWESHTTHMYDILNLAPKERCPMCQAVYFCGITFSQNLPRPSNLPAVRELGGGGHHGCCAEVLVIYLKPSAKWRHPCYCADERWDGLEAG